MCQERTYRGDIRRTWKDKQEFEWQGGKSGSWWDGEDVSGKEMANQKAKRGKIKKANRNKRSQVKKKKKKKTTGPQAKPQRRTCQEMPSQSLYSRFYFGKCLQLFFLRLQFKRADA